MALALTPPSNAAWVVGEMSKHVLEDLNNALKQCLRSQIIGEPRIEIQP